MGFCLTILKDDFIHINKEKEDEDKMNRQESYIERRKVKEEHKEWLQETLDHLQGKYFSIQSLRDKLVKEHPELRPVSTSTLWRIMKNEIKYNYKKSELRNPR